MKLTASKIFAIICIAICVLIGGLFIFLSTIDFNQYLPQVTQVVKSKLQRDVSIDSGELKFSFDKGVYVSLQKVRVEEDSSFGKTLFFEIDNVNASFDVIGYLTSKSISLGSVVFDSPKINLIRNSSGVWNYSSIVEALTSPDAERDLVKKESANGALAGGIASTVLIDQIKVVGGKVVYKDDLIPELQKEVVVNSIDLFIEEFSLLKTFDVKLNATIFSDQDNVFFDSTFDVDLENLSFLFLDPNVLVEMTSLDWKELIEAVPQIRQVQFKSFPKGNLQISLPRLELTSQGLKSGWEAMGQINLKDFSSSLLPYSIAELDSDFAINERMILIVKGDVGFAKQAGSLIYSGKIDQYRTITPIVDFTITAKDLQTQPLSEYAQIPFPLEGKFSVDTQIGFQGINFHEIQSTLNITGLAVFDKVVLKRFNIFNQIVEQLKAAPEIGGKIYQKLPMVWQSRLRQEDTILSNFEAAFGVSEGKVNIPALTVEAQGVSVTSQGQIGFIDKTANLSSNIVINQELSQGLVLSVSDLKVLLESDGQIHIPGNIVHYAPYFILDDNYLGQKLMKVLTNKAIEKLSEENPELGNVLGVLFGNSTPEKQEQSGSTKQQENTEKSSDEISYETMEGLLKGLLGN